MYYNKQTNNFWITEYLRDGVCQKEMRDHRDCQTTLGIEYMCDLHKAFGLYFKIIELPSCLVNIKYNYYFSENWRHPDNYNR